MQRCDAGGTAPALCPRKLGVKPRRCRFALACGMQCQRQDRMRFDDALRGADHPVRKVERPSVGDGSIGSPAGEVEVAAGDSCEQQLRRKLSRELQPPEHDIRCACTAVRKSRQYGQPGDHPTDPATQWTGELRDELEQGFSLRHRSGRMALGIEEQYPWDSRKRQRTGPGVLPRRELELADLCGRGPEILGIEQTEQRSDGELGSHRVVTAELTPGQRGTSEAGRLTGCEARIGRPAGQQAGERHSLAARHTGRRGIGRQLDCRPFRRCEEPSHVRRGPAEEESIVRVRRGPSSGALEQGVDRPTEAARRDLWDGGEENRLGGELNVTDHRRQPRKCVADRAGRQLGEAEFDLHRSVGATFGERASQQCDGRVWRGAAPSKVGGASQIGYSRWIAAGRRAQ
jgi:hypothetical protein